MMKVYVVRHGRTDWNDKGLTQGKSNVPINEKGITQAMEAKDKLKNVTFDVCISSPLKRTLQTAKIITNGKCNIITSDLLLERDMGDFEGKNHALYSKHNYWDYKENSGYNDVEPVKDLLKRTKTFIDELKNENYENVLIVSHAATIRAINYNIEGYDENTNFLEFKPKNGEVYQYKI